MVKEGWRDGEMERWRDGEMEGWRDGVSPGQGCGIGRVGSKRNKFFQIFWIRWFRDPVQFRMYSRVSFTDRDMKFFDVLGRA
jgi:hypothetical protein